MEAVGRLAGGVAHDFNNLILAMSLNAELARSTGAREPLDEITAVAERAGQLTRQLLVLSRREALTSRVVDLNHVVTNLVRILRRAIASSIRIDVDTSSQALLVRGDPSQLEQLLMNLCLNARDAMPDGGILSIRTERVPSASRSPSAGRDPPRGSHARLTVSDTGAGIPPEIRDRIFEPFFTTKPPGSGTGLGLATVYGVVEQHNGSVSVRSKPGHGACFEIDLPLHAEIGAVEVVRRREPARGGTETVLVAEDFAHVRRVVVSLLETAGYRVLSAAHGDEALECIREQGDEIALALLDVMMPFKTGPEVAALAIKTHPKMRILFTSGYSEAAPSLSSVPEERLLRKPYERDDLLRRIRRMLDEPIVTSPSA
jgi:CheY-like chemotaxis protein